MKAITIPQPWARLIAGGDLRWVPRQFVTDVRGGVAIHAAERMTPSGGRLAGELVFAGELDDYFPTGAIVGVGVLVAVHLRSYVLDVLGATERERRLLEPSPSSHLWEIAEPKPLAHPIEWTKGSPGVWDWTPPQGFEDPQC